MDCNKDEATRAKEIAEQKFMEKDFNGAKRFALKAQNLYPRLEGIPQMLATLDVYISAEIKINGEVDWYGILGVNPLSDDNAVRKKYRKLALILHPDKNKSVGADGAFKFLSEAWSLLSDKAKRMAYDQKRNAKAIQKGSIPSKGSSAPQGANGSYNFTKGSTSNVRAHKNTTATKKGQSSTPATSHKPKADTFWTSCCGCRMQYEYLRVYLNHRLLCPNCHQPFLAVETSRPVNSSKPPIPWNCFQQKQKSSNQQAGSNGSDSNNHTNFQWGPFSSAAGAPSTAQAATVVQQAYQKVKRQREEAQAATKREEARRRKHASKKTSGFWSAGYSSSAKRRKSFDEIGEMDTGTKGVDKASTSGYKPSNSETGRVNGISKPNNTSDLSCNNIQKLLLEKARTDIRKQMNDRSSASVVKTVTEKEDNGNQKTNGPGEKILVTSVTGDQMKPGSTLDADNGLGSVQSFPRTSAANMNAETVESMTISVPDPDFHDFDKDRTERSFGDNQVWAAYDNINGMPRYYAMIHSVICLSPFKMRISWLKSKTNSELGPLNWAGSGFLKTCGDFRVGKHEINNSLNSFSHKVRWAKGAHGTIHIYPRTGDVWALYRNWSPDWNELTPDEDIHKYDMVEVLEDYNEQIGVTVIPLVKVAGFKTVFHQHLDPREVRRIPREEMLRFSHRVPSYLLRGQEAPNAPKGCRELDPAATPEELLHVIPYVKEEVFAENEEKVMSGNLIDDLRKGMEQEVVEIEDTEKYVEEEEKGLPKDIHRVETVHDTPTNKIDEIVDHSEEMAVC